MAVVPSPSRDPKSRFDRLCDAIDHIVDRLGATFERVGLLGVACRRMLARWRGPGRAPRKRRLGASFTYAVCTLVWGVSQSDGKAMTDPFTTVVEAPGGPLLMVIGVGLFGAQILRWRGRD